MAEDEVRAGEAADQAALLLLRRYRTGDRGAAAELFDAWFDRTLAYATVWLGDPHLAERATVLALRDVLESAASDGQRAGFRALLVSRLHAAGGAPAYDPPPGRPRPPRDDNELLRNLGKLSATDIYLLLVRLPVAERRLLGLLHLLKLTPEVAGPLLGLDAEALHAAERGALRELRLAVERFGRSGSRDLDRLASHTFGVYSPVVRSRWAALTARI
jgi:DNA-directed RNA polymerase specialized sigma24 family protein